jgi:mRNA interferase MazF
MLKQRDIVLVPIPFTDLSSIKRRPVVVISGDHYNQKNDDIIVAAITSNIQYQTDYTILISSENLSDGVLPKQSIIRSDKIYTISRDIVVKHFGTVNAGTFKILKMKIDQLLTE